MFNCHATTSKKMLDFLNLGLLVALVVTWSAKNTLGDADGFVTSGYSSLRNVTTHKNPLHHAESPSLATATSAAGAGTPPLPRIAVAVQGDAHSISKWHAVLERMRTRNDVAFFGLIWGVGLINQDFVAEWGKNNSAIKIFSEPNSTWTEGRNSLARAIYSAEVARGKQFQAWTFADSDIWHGVECSRCPFTVPLGPEGSACCLDYLFQDVVLNEHYVFPTISSMVEDDERSKLQPLMNTSTIDATFVFRDCADAQLQVFDRQAVPVLLPYHSELDGRSWWSSQSILFQYLSGCFSGSNVVLGRDFRCASNDHNPYPRGELDLAKELEIVATLFPELMTFPLNISTNPAFRPLTCRSPSKDIRTLDPRNINLLDWKHSEAFITCLKTKEPYFIQMVGQGFPPASPS
jgi:hypothetical protein